MYKCKKCKYETNSISNIGNHYRWKHKLNDNIICELCNKSFKDVAGYGMHKKRCKGIIYKHKNICPKCNVEIKTGGKNFDKHVKCCNGEGPRKLIKRRPGGHSWAKNKSYDDIYGKKQASRIKKSISRSLKGNKTWDNIDENKKNDIRKKASKRIKERYEKGWMPKAGRCKTIIYESKTAGFVKLNGSWELGVAKYLDEQNLNWARNKKRFRYIFENKERNYTPDFYVKEWNAYIEVKGYETNMDKAKWSQFPLKLIIWKKKELVNKNIL